MVVTHKVRLAAQRDKSILLRRGGIGCHQRTRHRAEFADPITDIAPALDILLLDFAAEKMPVCGVHLDGLAGDELDFECILIIFFRQAQDMSHHALFRLRKCRELIGGLER